VSYSGAEDNCVSDPSVTTRRHHDGSEETLPDRSQQLLRQQPRKSPVEHPVLVKSDRCQCCVILYMFINVP